MFQITSSDKGMFKNKLCWIFIFIYIYHKLVRIYKLFSHECIVRYVCGRV